MASNWALRHAESRRERPLLWLLVDLAAGSAMTVLLWVVVNETSALVFACLWAVLVVIGWLSRSRRKPNDHT